MDSSSLSHPQIDSGLDAGWTRRFTASEPRLSEMAALYRSLGLDVRLGEPTPEPGQECLTCHACLLDPSVKTVYTRPLPQQGRKRSPRRSRSPQ